MQMNAVYCLATIDLIAVWGNAVAVSHILFLGYFPVSCWPPMLSTRQQLMGSAYSG